MPRKKNTDPSKITNKKGNPQYLIPINTRPKEEQDAMRKKAGETTRLRAQIIKEERKKRQAMADSMSEILNLSIKTELYVTDEELRELGILIDKELTAQDAMLLAQMRRAIKGDTQSATFIRDTVGDKPVEKVESVMTIEDYVKEHKPKF